MSRDNKNIDKMDDFSKLVKQKLENHQLPLSDDIWAGIERKMAKPRHRRIMPWYWIASGVAAMIALLLLVWPIQDISKSARELAVQTEVGMDKEPKPTVSAREPASNLADTDFQHYPQSIPAVQRGTAGLFPKKTKKLNLHADNHINTPVSRIVDKKEDQTASTETISQENESAAPENNTDTQSQSGKASDKTAETQSTTRKTESFERLPDLNDYPVIPEQPKRIRKKRPILLAASFGAGGNGGSAGIQEKDYASPQMNDATPPRQLVSKAVSESYAGILTADDYSNAEHQPPLSIGIALEKTLTERISLESGLVYTYLKSVYRNPGSVDKNGTLQLHYLGIPLNVKVKAVKQPNWNLYVAAGGMVEKGLRSFYRQDVESMSITTSKDVKSNIDGLQWSVSGGVGLNYKLTKDLSLFVEPKVIYYLENNQPMNARTEQPLNMGINGGLRIEL